MDDTVNWNAHITYRCNKASKQVGLVCRKAWTVDPTPRVTIYKSMIHPMLEYGVILFDGCAAKNDLLLEKVQ